MIIRHAKIALVLGVGLFAALAAFTNLTISEVTFPVVRDAVGMGDVIHHPNVNWRAIESPFVAGILFALIVLAEAVGGVLCLWGGFRLWRARAATATRFDEAKSMALAGLAVIALLYLVGFLAILGEWFLMWSTQGLNVLADSLRAFVPAMLVLIYLSMPEAENRDG